MLQCNNFGGFMDICEYSGRIYAIQNSSQFKGGRLCVFDTKLRLIASFEKIGDARQIKISNGIAVVSARANGLFILDVSKNEPELLSHYKTIEFATGVTIYSNIVFVSCRQYGVEVIDISLPQKPLYKEIIRAGEVQSTCVYNDVLYCGLWGDMKVIAFDIKDINAPKKVLDINLHGRGDGVVVRDNLLYAVSGQHGRNIKNFNDPLDNEYGNGNGISIFDISKNCEEIFFDNFGKGYSVSHDTWKPLLCGNVLVCCDSVLGIHLYDAKTFEKLDVINFPEINGIKDAVTSAVSCENILFVTTAYGGIFAFDNIKFEKTYEFSSDEKINLIKRENQFCGNLNFKKVYSGDFSVLSMCAFNDNYIIACGSDGLHVVDKDFKLLFKVEKNDFCCDVKATENYIIGAFSEDGVCIFEIKNNSLNEVASYKEGKAIQQLLLSESKKYLACCLESTEVIMLDVSDVECIKKLYSRKAKYGPLYGENFASRCLNDGTMLMFWHRDGVVYTNPDKLDSEFKGIFYDKTSGFMCFGPESGFDTDGENMFFNIDGGYVILPFENVDVDTLKKYKTNEKIKGKFIVADKKIIAIERAEGVITVTDISHIEKPEFVGKAVTTASCSKPICIDNLVFIPSWHDGLLELIL